MGTKVELDNFLPGNYSMRDLNCDSNGGSWPAYYGDNGYPNGQYYYGFLPRGFSDSYPGNKKDLLKQKMLEHEAIFKNQVYELHRLYRVQRDLMDEFKRKEGYKLETSSSSSPLPSHIPSEDTPKWNTSSFALGNSFASKVHVSPLNDAQTSASANKGKSIQVGSIPFQDSSSPKDSEVSESRPTKFRRKMLDLQLPANEYIGTDEVKQCDEAKNTPDLNHKTSSESRAKLFVNNKEKIEGQGNCVTSGSLPRKSNTLADLNEPFVVEEHTSVPFAEISSNIMPREGSSSGIFLGLPRGIHQISRHDNSNGTSCNVQAESKGYGRGWFSYILEAEQSREKLLDIMPVPSKPVQSLLDSASCPPGFSSNSTEELWRTKPEVERNYFQNGFYDSESYLRAQRSTPSSLSHASDLVNAWDRPALSWEKPGMFLSQKPMLIQPNPCMNSVTFSRSSVQSNEPFSVSSMYNSNFRANLDSGSEMPFRSGFYLGSSSGSRDLMGRASDNNRARGSSDCFIIPSPQLEANSRKDMNLNSVLLSGFPTYQLQMKTMGGASKFEDRHPSLSWLTGKGVSSKEFVSPTKALNSLESALFQAPSDQFSKDELKKSLDRLNSVASTSSIGPRHKMNDHSSSRMILGVPIFEKPLVSKEHVASSVAGPSCGAQPFSNKESVVSIPKTGFDINVPYVSMDFEHDKTTADEDFFEKKIVTGGSCLRDHIDLNSHASDDNVLPVSSNMKRVIDIDLEAPARPETEDDDLLVEEPSLKPENQALEVPQCSGEELEVASLVRAAAEAIVEISASVIKEHVVDSTMHASGDLSESPLHWFAGAIFVDDAANHLGANTSRSTLGGVPEDCLSSDSGYFEAMTLKLTEYDAEECLSKPPQVLNAEVIGTNASGNRARRGPARRGRQRRDFQRDILPGLTSLSRHEVTEDLQTFGGLMRATGYAWHSGPRRNATRNGCARGKRRSLVTAATNPQAANTVCALLRQQLSNSTGTINTTTAASPVRLEDRSLTGWGRTTRRPRRQRFPGGNPAAIALT